MDVECASLTVNEWDLISLCAAESEVVAVALTCSHCSAPLKLLIRAIG